MADDDSVLENKWYENVIEAAKHLALGNYYTSRPSSNLGGAPSSTAVTVTLKNPENDFMRHRGGVIIVDIGQDEQYEVVVETNNGITSIKPRRKDR